MSWLPWVTIPLLLVFSIGFLLFVARMSARARDEEPGPPGSADQPAPEPPQNINTVKK
jgi:hypothetical protein